MAKKFYKSFRELDSKRFPRERKKIKLKHLSELDAKKYPNEDKTIRRINNMTEFKLWLDTTIGYWDNRISPRDIIATQYYAARKFDLGEMYGYGTRKNVYERFVADASLKEVRDYMHQIRRFEPFDYAKTMEMTRKKMPKEVINNLWRNVALANFITIVNATPEKKRKKSLA